MSDELEEMGEGEEGEIEITREDIPPEIEMQIMLDVCAGLLWRVINFARDTIEEDVDLEAIAADIEAQTEQVKQETSIFLDAAAHADRTD